MLTFKGVKLEPELIASIQEHADRLRLTWSALVRQTLRERFGLLRIERDGRNASYRRASVRGRAKARQLQTMKGG